jgi:hypothetical protein
MGKRALIAGVAAVLCVAVLAPTACADDRSVYDAWVGRDADFTHAGKTFSRAMRDSHYRTAARALRRGLRLIEAVTTSIGAQAPSSEAGRRGKTAALESMSLFRYSLVHKLRGVKAALHHHRRVAEREFRRGVSLSRRSLQAQNTARQAFTEAGVQIKP